MKKVDISDIIVSTVCDEIDKILTDPETKGILRGYYTAQHEIVAECMGRGRTREEAKELLSEASYYYKYYLTLGGTDNLDAIPLYMTVEYAQEIVRKAFLPEGKPDAISYHELAIYTAMDYDYFPILETYEKEFLAELDDKEDTP